MNDAPHQIPPPLYLERKRRKSTCRFSRMSRIFFSSHLPIYPTSTNAPSRLTPLCQMYRSFLFPQPGCSAPGRVGLGGKKCLLRKWKEREGRGKTFGKAVLFVQAGGEARLICYAVHFQRKIAHALKVKL